MPRQFYLGKRNASFNIFDEARRDLAVNMPKGLDVELAKTATRLGKYGVKIAKALVPVRTGRTRELIRYKIDRKPGRFRLTVFVDHTTKAEALAAYVSEFGRGHGRAGLHARGHLPPRPYYRRSRELVRKRAKGSFAYAMRKVAKAQFHSA